MNDEPPRTLTTVETTLRVIHGLKELDGATVTELAGHLDLSKGCVYNHLATLHTQKLLTKSDGEYRLGFGFLQLGQFVKHHSILYNVAKPKIDEMVDRTGEAGNLM